MGFDSSTPDLPAILKPLQQIHGNDPRAILALQALRRRLRRKKGRAGTILHDETVRLEPEVPTKGGNRPDDQVHKNRRLGGKGAMRGFRGIGQ